MLYREELELERLRWRLRPGDLDRERRRTGDLRLGERDLQEGTDKSSVRRHSSFQQRLQCLQIASFRILQKNLIDTLKEIQQLQKAEGQSEQE